MTNVIPEGQKCQSFNPIMILPEKTKYLIKDFMKANTSCFALAYVYLEGTRGKRFLCDVCYLFEKRITVLRTPELWPDIAKVLINNIESIRDTFAKNDGIQQISNDSKCFCDATAYVKLTYKNIDRIEYLCNAHFRKFMNRHLNHGQNYEDNVYVRDERHRLNKTMEQEFFDLKMD